MKKKTTHTDRIAKAAVEEAIAEANAIFVFAGGDAHAVRDALDDPVRRDHLRRLIVGWLEEVAGSAIVSTWR